MHLICILFHNCCIFFLTNSISCGILRYNQERENMNKLKNGDMITDNGISYVIEMDEDGTLWGVSNNAEYEIEISEDYIPDEISFSA